ncbi:stalk domain-containing protein [Paenibacillus sp. FSL R7-0345]|uniref:stalk domain-containing protein n=1 Tax=Paenibacillus sp. FSL R7-0345 TaxID=2954535 RepID=UPI00315AB111
MDSNQQTVMQEAPLLLKERQFVPIRFVAEQLNASVEYMGSKHRVVIFKNEAA